MDVSLTKINQGGLLSLENPTYEQLIRTYSHLSGVEMDDTDAKPLLLIHVILGTGKYAQIKTGPQPHIGNQVEPVAERIKFGWIILTPGKEFDTTHMLLTQTSQLDYEELCRLNVLELVDTQQHDQGEVYKQFQEQLLNSDEG